MKKMILFIIPLIFVANLYAESSSLFEDIEKLKVEEKAMGIASGPSSSDETYNFIDNMSKIIKDIEAQDEKIPIDQNAELTKQIDDFKANILSEKPYKEINIYAIDVVAQKINNASSKFYGLRDILNPHLTNRKNKMSTVVFYNTYYNRSLREYFTKISYSILNGEVIKEGDPRVQKASYDSAINNGYSIKDNKIFLSGSKDELDSIRNFKEVVEENGGKSNKTEALNKLETLRKTVEKFLANGSQHNTEGNAESERTGQD